MNKYWSSRIKDMTPYVPGEQPKEGEFIKINQNENPYPPSPGALQAIRDAATASLRIYPDPDCTEFREALAEFYGIKPEQVFVGNGSDEILAFCYPAFFDSDILFADITYGFYPVYADFFNVSYKIVPLNDDFTLPVQKFCEKNGGILIPNPNAPTGIALKRAEIETILQANPDSVVVIDEAYVDFGTESAVPLIDQYENLLVVHTFSKARSLAGLRVGFALGNTELIEALNCVKNSINSFTLDRGALAAAVASVRDRAYFESTCQKVAATRDKTAIRLRALGFEMTDSTANFLFVRHPQKRAEELYIALRERGILVRYFNKPRIDDYLRISIGTDEDMDAVIDALTSILG